MHDILDDILMCVIYNNGSIAFLNSNLLEINDSKTKGCFNRLILRFSKIDLSQSSKKNIEIFYDNNSKHSNFNISQIKEVYIDKFLYADFSKLNLSVKRFNFQKITITLWSESTIPELLPDEKYTLEINKIYINRSNIVEDSILIQSDSNNKFFMQFLFKDSSKRLRVTECTKTDANVFKNYFKIKNKEELIKACYE